MALYTQEVRWFFAGALGDAGAGVERWFVERPPLGDRGRTGPVGWEPPEPEPWRDDRYLLVPGAEDLGLKWREGQFQLKGREASLGVQRFAAGVEGLAERWVKWSYGGAEVERRFQAWFRPGGGAAAGLLRVDKRRAQRRIRVEPDGSAREVPSGTPLACGLDVELARIRLDGSRGETHWTLGCEAFPAGSNAVRARFNAIVGEFFADFPLRRLSAERSLSYPAWLRQFDRAPAD